MRSSWVPCHRARWTVARAVSHSCAADNSPAKIHIDAAVAKTYAAASPLQKLRYADAESIARPKDSPNRALQMNRPSTALASRPQASGNARRRPRTAPVGVDRSIDLYTAAAVDAVVESQRAAQERLMQQIMVHEAWVQSKRDVAQHGQPSETTRGLRLSKEG
jgi:hypothetical protein